MRMMFGDRHVRPSQSSVWLIVKSSIWMAAFGNVALWKSLSQLPDITGSRRLIFGLAFLVIIASTLVSLMAMLNWRGCLRPVISVFLILSAISTHFMLSYGIVVDTPTIVNVFQSDTREALEQISWRLLLTVLLLAGAPMALIWRQPLLQHTWRKQLLHNAVLWIAGMCLTIGATFLVFQDFASLMRNHITLRYQINPVNTLYGVLDVAMPSHKVHGVVKSIGLDAHIATRSGANSDKPPFLLLVLGETARSQNFSLNGYTRPTNTLLSQQNVTSFTQVRSCGTSTAASLPCMFSHLERSAFETRNHNFENLLDVLQHAGYAVLWIDNQSGCKGQCARIPYVNTSTLNDEEHCAHGECRDMVMLKHLETEWAQLPAERRARGTIVVMHQMGSHGPAYFKRSPQEFKKFQPECTHTSLSQCDQQQVMNAYDNTLVYTDYFLSQTIDWLKSKEKVMTPALLYVSDHGESLGEKNLYLHGLPLSVAPPEQTAIPLITWLSPSFEQSSRLSTRCLQQKRHKALSHDNLFHSVLGLMAVKTSFYQRDLDLFVSCEAR